MTNERPDSYYFESILISLSTCLFGCALFEVLVVTLFATNDRFDWVD
jgi:hypothetical protein